MGAAHSNNFTLPKSPHTQSTGPINKDPISTTSVYNRSYRTCGHQQNYSNRRTIDDGSPHTLPKGHPKEQQQQGQGASKVFFLLHRTWAVIVTDKWQRAKLNSSGNSSSTNTTASTAASTPGRSRIFERSRSSTNIRLPADISGQPTKSRSTISVPELIPSSTSSDEISSDLHNELFISKAHRSNHTNHQRHKRRDSSDSSSTTMSSSWSLTGSSVSFSSVCTCSQCCRSGENEEKSLGGNEEVQRADSISSGEFCNTTYSR